MCFYGGGDLEAVEGLEEIGRELIRLQRTMIAMSLFSDSQTACQVESTILPIVVVSDISRNRKPFNPKPEALQAQAPPFNSAQVRKTC